jgi:anti-sigma B factor antagonist
LVTVSRQFSLPQIPAPAESSGGLRSQNHSGLDEPSRSNLPLERRPLMAVSPLPISELNLETSTTPEETVIRCTGRITSTTSGTLQAAVRSHIAEGKRIAVDLSDVNYMDSSGLGALVSVYVSAKRQHCQLRLINVGPRLQQLFRLTKLNSVFEGHDDFLGLTPD